MKKQKRARQKEGKKLETQIQDSEGAVKGFLDLITPSVLRFYPGYLICGNTYRAVWAIRDYPAATEEQALLKHLGKNRV